MKGVKTFQFFSGMADYVEKINQKEKSSEGETGHIEVVG